MSHGQEAGAGPAPAPRFVGGWEWDLVRDAVTWSPEMVQLFALSTAAAAPACLDDYLAVVHPADRDLARAAAERLRTTPGPHAVRHRVVIGGEVRWIEAHSQVLCDRHGRPQRAVGTAHDVTEEVLAGQRAEAGMIRRDSTAVVGPAATVGQPAGGRVTVDELRRAIEGDELELHYQPKVAVATSAVVGVEALVRWRHPQRGLVPPGEFIGVAEEADLMGALGAVVLEEAAAQWCRWRGAGLIDDRFVMAVNVSARQIGPELPAQVAATLAGTGMAPGALYLELTETAVMQRSDLAAGLVDELKALGVAISIDDFGTGYSSLAYLRRFAPAEVKVDRSFVAGLEQDAGSRAIVAAIVAMAHALGATVIAEGVETPAQLDQLRSLGCELTQGFLFSPALPGPEVEGLLGHKLSTGAGGDTHAVPGTPRDTVLVVDDSADIRQLAQVSLRSAGFDTVEAGGGDEAIETARRLRPDCVVLDVDMPGRSGIDVAAALRADPRTAMCAVVMLTGDATKEGRIAAFAAGADEYIVKPFSPRGLVADVGAALRRRRDAER